MSVAPDSKQYLTRKQQTICFWFGFFLGTILTFGGLLLASIGYLWNHRLHEVPVIPVGIAIVGMLAIAISCYIEQDSSRTNVLVYFFVIVPSTVVFFYFATDIVLPR